MNKPKMICFDMDGTIADLYNVPNWLEMLRDENPAPYLNAEPMWDMVRMAETLKKIQQAGIEIRIITWLSMNSTEEYKVAVREAKRAWLEKWGFVFDHFHNNNLQIICFIFLILPLSLHTKRQRTTYAFPALDD